MKTQGATLREKASAILGVPSEEVKAYSSASADAHGLLDLRSEFKTGNIKCSAHSHRRTKFGHYAKTRIIRSAGALDLLDSNPRNYLFLTATLPSDGDWAKWAIAEDSHNLINGFKAWLSKRVRSRHEFYVWEHQGRGALHFHYCVHVPDTEVRDAIARDFRAQWMRLLDGMTARTGVCAWGKHAHLDYEARYAIIQTRAEIVNQSVSKYMAGYCGGKKDKHEIDARIPYYPKRWFGVSRGLSELVKQHTETESEFYSSYRAAKNTFDKFHDEFSAESLTFKKFKHKIGIGETSASYHLPENLNELWQSRKAMKYTTKSHRNIKFWIQTALTCQRTVSRLDRGSQIFRTLSCNLPIESLKDGCFEGSLQRGTLHESQVRAIESLWLKLSSHSNLPPSLTPLLIELSMFIRIRSANFPLIRWNRHGWLDTIEDFPCTVDSNYGICETRTRPTDEGTPSGVDSYSAHVASEPKPGPSQLSLI